MSGIIVAHPNAQAGRAAAAARLARQDAPAIVDTAPITYTGTVVRVTVVRTGAGGATPTLSDPDAVAALARELIPDDARAPFGVFLLNARHDLIADHEVSTGTRSAALVHPREVVGPVLRRLGIASLILVHSHPSGDPGPSVEDKRRTRQLVEAGTLLAITIHDHVILGNGSGRSVSRASRRLF